MKKQTIQKKNGQKICAGSSQEIQMAKKIWKDDKLSQEMQIKMRHNFHQQKSKMFCKTQFGPENRNVN